MLYSVVLISSLFFRPSDLTYLLGKYGYYASLGDVTVKIDLLDCNKKDCLVMWISKFQKSVHGSIKNFTSSTLALPLADHLILG